MKKPRRQTSRNGKSTARKPAAANAPERGESSGKTQAVNTEVTSRIVDIGQSARPPVDRSQSRPPVRLQKSLEHDRTEIDALFNELLLLATDFFRDSQVFLALKDKVFPKILSEKPIGEPIRIWVAGCSTGEEVYSIAITLRECLGDAAQHPQIQIFGTDVSDSAIERARLGIYPAASVTKVARESLRRYFTEFDGIFRINQSVREMCVFARHDLTCDPPFSKMDLISCRNVLTYMEPALQKRILSRFHWALRDGGVLLIGKSESQGAHPDMFTATDEQNMFFTRSIGTRVPLDIAQPNRAAHDQEVSRLREELARTREHMQLAVREQAALNDELKTANQEAVSSIEKLKGINDQLETDKEELLSSNEGLVTLNEQLQNRNSELSRLSSDAGNVLSGADIPIVILGPDSRIRRFTPAAEMLLGLISADVGRHISKFRLGINVPDLDDLIAKTVKKGEVSMRDVQSEFGRWYSLRIRPFIADDKVEGVLMAFVDIHEIKNLQERETGRADQSESVIRALLENAAQAILAIDREGRIKLANVGAEKMFGYSRDTLVGKHLESLLPERFRARHAQHREGWFALPRNRAMGIGLDLAAIRKDGSEFPIEVGLSSIVTNDESLAVAFISDITERKKAERALIDYRDQLASEVSALERLRETSERLWRLHDLRSGLQLMIDAGISLLGANMGNIQLLDTEKPVLKIVAQRGFGPDFLKHFCEVSAEDDSACGRSLRTRQRIIIQDVNIDRAYAPHRAAAAAAGYRAVQATPMFDSNAKPLGIFSTHFREPHRPTEEELSRFDLYAHQAAQFIERVKADERLKGLTGALLQMQESGNREVARELHDVFSQELVGVGMEVSSLAKNGKSKEEIQRLSDLSKKIMVIADDIHCTARELHPAVLEDLGLAPALQQECESFKKVTGIATNFSPNNVPSAIPREVALCLYRVAQESLRNIRKHAANTDSVLVSLKGGTNGITLLVEDSGDGFDLDQALKKGGLGLVSMEERVRLVNGRFAIHSAIGQRTRVEAFVPLNRNLR